MRAYSQLGVLTEGSEKAGCPSAQAVFNLYHDPKYTSSRTAFLTQYGKLYANCAPNYHAGEAGQWRNFYNPEFDANLTDFMHWTAADEFKVRLAWWGFYDGIYDYLSPEWNQHRQQYMGRFAETDSPAKYSTGYPPFGQAPGQPGAPFNDHNKNARHVYAEQSRINELYFDYTHGPLFVRVGKQTISWGESDTIALLDVSNPFDLTLGAPGFFQDVDEARIPLWTLPRITYKLFENWGPLSSVFADAYLVPGIIEPTSSSILGPTLPINPITAGVSPFNPDVNDPQLNIWAQGQGNSIHTDVVDKLPKSSWGNSRWGARLTGILLRDYTVQGWFFRTFNQQPVPLLVNDSAFNAQTSKHGAVIDDRGFRVPTCVNNRTPAGRFCSYAAPAVSILERRLESVIGLATTWFSQPANAILKAEAELFIGEPAFIPSQNLNPRVQLPASIRKAIGDTAHYSNSTATANYVRWVLGMDRNFFYRPLNPTNSFILVSSFNVTQNVSGGDYRQANPKPGHSGTSFAPIPGVAACSPSNYKGNPLCISIDPHDYERQYRFDSFLQTTLRTDYMHGRLEPQLTFIVGLPGYYAVQPTVTYRVNDNLLLGATYSMIAGAYKADLGTFRSHDMVQIRATVQLN